MIDGESTEQPAGPDGAVARFLLVRHGESTWNAVRRWQGRADPPLSERGEQQARDAVGRATAEGPFDGVVTSTLRRARRTGDLLADGLGLDVVDRLDDLCERDAGEWQGLTRDEIHAGYPGFLDEGRRPPGYEADDDVVERAGRALVDLARRRPGSTLLVVSHGGVINALERHGGRDWLRLDNLEGRWFHLEPDGGGVRSTPGEAGSDPSLRPTGDRVHLLGDVGSVDDPPTPGYA